MTVATLLNEQLPSLNHLENVQTLLDEKKRQRDEIQSKLHQLNQENPSKVLEIRNLAKKTLQEVRGLYQERQSILKDHETLFGENSNIAKSLVQLQHAQTRLSNLELSKTYLEALLRVDSLSFDIHTHVTGVNVKKALTTYDQLFTEWTKIDKTTKVSGKDVAPSLKSYMTNVLVGAYEDLKTRLMKRLLLAQDGIGWPNSVAMKQISDDLARADVVEEKMNNFREAFVDLLLFQRANVDKPERLINKYAVDETFLPHKLEPLLAIQGLLEPVIIRFRYHFTGNKPTNRLDKPEWFLSHVTNLIRDYTSFLFHEIQPLLNNNDYGEYDAKNEFIDGMVGAVVQKIRNDVPKLLDQPNLLPHYVNEVLLFDENLRDGQLFQPNGLVVSDRWKGTVSVFTDKKDWFTAWLRVEKTQAKDAFNFACLGTDSWDLFYDSTLSDIDDMKPTKSSEELTLLVDSIKERYKLLPGLSQRAAFLSEIQLEVINDYVKLIDSEMDKFQEDPSLLSFLGMENVRKDDAAVVQLCRWASSLHHVSSTLEVWGDEVFYLTLWQDLCASAQAKGLTIPKSQTTIFSDALRLYQTCLDRVLDALLASIMAKYGAAVKNYEKKRNWSVMKPLKRRMEEGKADEDGMILPTDISQEYCEALSVLSHAFLITSQNLAQPLFQQIVKSTCSRVEERLITNVIMAHQFTLGGAQQLDLDVDMGLWQGVYRRWLRKPPLHFKRLKEALYVLNLPLLPTDTTPSLNQVLDQAEQVFEDGQDSIQFSTSLGIYRLEFDEIIEIIRRRTE